MERATFAGGCFWCTEAIFKRLNGVFKVTSGYAGAWGDNPTYEKVSTGKTGFTEAVQIEFDPSIISYENLLDIFWATHDPTTLNRQGPDTGTQYRSAIFCHNKTQHQQALNSRKKLEKAHKYNYSIVTEISPIDHFYAAEGDHQNYYDTYKNLNPYCSIVIEPKIQKLVDQFNFQVKKEYKEFK